METSDNPHKSYIQLSKHESALLNKVEDFVVFSISRIKKLTNWTTPTIKNTLASLKKKGIITAIKKDNFVVTEQIPEKIFKIANLVAFPSYISFWTALSYYGFTEQQVRSIQVISTQQYPRINVKGHVIETTTFNPDKFYGYQKLNSFTIADKEKLIIDSLYKLENIGGIEEFKKCLKNAWSELNQERLFKYLKRFNNKSLFARLGYLIEELKLKNKLEKKYLKNLPLGFVRLVPQDSLTKEYSRKWMVIVND